MSGASQWKHFEGSCIDNTYWLRELVGVGGFGGVFFSDHIIEGVVIRRVAVKLIEPNADLLQRQLAELTAATTLRHDHILACFHAGSTNLFRSKVLFLVMQLADESLATCLDRNSVSVQDTFQLAEQLASALAYLHADRRIHRDLKPANVLRVGVRWVLSDFGTIRTAASDSTSRTGLITGTLAYMPPESFDGIVSPAWDMWSFGVLLLRTLTGRTPFPELPEIQLMRMIDKEEPAVPTDLPAPFDAIIRGCLTKNYRARWSADQVSNTLREHRKIEEEQATSRQSERLAALKSESIAHGRSERSDVELPALTRAPQADLADSELGGLVSDANAARISAAHVPQEFAQAAAEDGQRANPGRTAQRGWRWVIAVLTLGAVAAVGISSWHILSIKLLRSSAPRETAPASKSLSGGAVPSNPAAEEHPKPTPSGEAAASKPDDLPEYRVAKTFPVPRVYSGASLSSDGRFLAMEQDRNPGEKKFWIDVWDCADGTLVRSIHDDDYRWEFQISPDGSAVALSQSVHGADSVTMYYRDGTSKAISDAAYARFAFSSRDRLIALETKDGIELFHYDTGELAQRVAIDRTRYLALSPGGKWLAIIRMPNSSLPHELYFSNLPRNSEPTAATKKLKFSYEDGFAFSSDDSRFVIAHGGHIVSWNPSTAGSTSFDLPITHRRLFTHVYFYGSSTLLLASSGEFTELWEVESKRRIWRIARQRGDSSTVLSGDGRVLARSRSNKVYIYTRK